MPDDTGSLLEAPTAGSENDEPKPTEPSQPEQQNAATEAAVRDHLSDEDMALVRARMRRRLLDTYHHRPGRLWVSVNGIPVASLDICSKWNKLNLTTRVAEPLQFIEVFSEQQIRLAMLNANPEDANIIETKANISLSDKRKLRVSFADRDSELTIRLGYTDPEIEGWERLAALGLKEVPSLADEQ